MKVVLFCGGLGTRLKAYSDVVPKAMVNIGERPILWHLMKYYAHYGHTEFILCLGYRGEIIKQYFQSADMASANDLVLSRGGDDVLLNGHDGEAWRIRLVDTGLTASIGQRLKAAQPFLEDDEVFLANYADGLSDLELPAYLDYFADQNKVAAFACVRPHHSFHVVELDDTGAVRGVRYAGESGVWINGGFFAFKRTLFDYMKDGEDLVAEPFQRLLDAGQLAAYRHEGFWHCMDTFKDKQAFDDMTKRGETPWEIWRHSPTRDGCG